MKIRTASEVQSLDEELHLFDEQDWSFMSVIDSRDNNYEYFNDIRDEDFVKRKKIGAEFILIFIMTVVIVIVGAVTVYKVIFSDMAEYRKVAGMQSSVQAPSMSYVEGKDAESSDVIGVSLLLSDYFGYASSESDYTSLYDMCVGTSTFADTYYASVSKVESLYDKYDCYARVLRELASYCSVNKINKLVIKDDVYYCYVDVRMPSTSNIEEYLYLYSYNFTKEFSNGVFSEASVMKYLLKNMDECKVPVTSSEICVKLTKSGDKFLILDDSFLTSVCVDDYATAVNQLTALLGNGSANGF